MQETVQDHLDTPRNPAEVLGSLLTNVRLERGLEQREAATRMGLSLDIVRALEEGRLHGLEAPVFVRSYLLRYARLLGISEQEVLQHYRQVGLSEAPPLRVEHTVKPQTKMSDRGVRWFSYLLVFAVVGWLGWLGFEEVKKHWNVSDDLASPAAFSENEDTLLPLPQQPEVPVAIPDTTPSIPITPQVREPVATVPPNSTPAAAGDSISETPAEGAVSQLIETESSPAAAEVSPSETESASDAVDEDRLVLELTGDCWVDIKDAEGEQLAYGTLRAGTTHTLSGSAPFSLILGNSGAVRIELNGKTIDPDIYVRRGGVSRFMLGAQSQQSTGT